MQKFSFLKLVFWYFSVPANAYFIQSVLPQVWKCVPYYVKKDHAEFLVLLFMKEIVRF